MTIKLTVRNSAYTGVAVNVTGVQYATSSSNCYSEWCKTYTTPSSADWAIAGGDGRSTAVAGSVITLKAPSGGWTKGDYVIKTTVSGSAGSATITGGYTKVKDFTVPNITVIAPINNATYNATNLTFSATTSSNAQCSFSFENHQNFYNWRCGAWNATNLTNGTVPTPQTKGACNLTLYNYTGTTYYSEYLSQQQLSDTRDYERI